MDNLIKKEEKENKIFFIIFFVLIFISIGYTFYKIVILKDYQIVSQVSCDPSIEKCFISRCDPLADNTCSASSTMSYYKKISKKAANIYACEKTPEKVGCNDELNCTLNEKDCIYILCDIANLTGGEQCSK